MFPSSLLEWDDFVRTASVSWEDRITTWVRRKNVMFVFFEDLKSDLRTQLVRILTFLQAPVDEARLDCTEAYPEGEFHRSKNKTERSFDPYSDKHKVIIEGHIRNASRILRETGHINHDLSYTGLDK